VVGVVMADRVQVWIRRNAGKCSDSAGDRNTYSQ